MLKSTKSEVFIINSTLLSRYSALRCGISTRQGGVGRDRYKLNLSFNVGDVLSNVRKNREIFFSKLDINQNQLAIPKQVHQDSVKRVFKPGVYKSCDALVTNEAGIFLVVTIADCLPILLYDPEIKSIGIVHAGWRGSMLRILEKTIRCMNIEFSSKTKNIITFIGPSVGVCCYEIGEEVARKFDSKYLIRRDNGNIHLDLKGFNKDILMLQGVSKQNIEISDYCTICNPNLFHSYRREGKKSGRMMAVIGLNS